MHHSFLVKSVEQFGTPQFVYDSQIIREKFKALQSALPRKVKIHYSLKANPVSAIAALFKTLGAGVEVASEGEMAIAFHAGFQPTEILVIAPGKTDSFLCSAVDSDVKAIVCESIGELNRLAQIASGRSKIIRVALRLNPQFPVRGGRMRMAGGSSQFGLENQNWLQALKVLEESENLRLVGLHCYLGTQFIYADDIAANTRNILGLFEAFMGCFSESLEFLNIGGGYGVSYSDKQPPFEIEDLKKTLLPVLENFETRYPSLTILVEAGRFLVAESGSFVTRILDVKDSKGQSYAISDGGTNCFAAAGGQGGFFRTDFPIEVIPRSSTSYTSTRTYNLVGPLCTPGDILALDRPLPEIAPGDLLVIRKAGAYGPSASPIGFLSHGHPCEVLKIGTDLHLIRKADQINEAYRHHIIPPILLETIEEEQNA